MYLLTSGHAHWRKVSRGRALKGHVFVCLHVASRDLRIDIARFADSLDHEIEPHTEKDEGLPAIMVSDMLLDAGDA